MIEFSVHVSDGFPKKFVQVGGWGELYPFFIFLNVIVKRLTMIRVDSFLRDGIAEKQPFGLQSRKSPLPPIPREDVSFVQLPQSWQLHGGERR